MTMNERILMRRHRGVGLIEVMISIVIAMLLVLVIYQVYEISEGQKRTITGGSDAQQNASYGLYVLGRDLAMAGNGIASSALALDDCPILRPIPVVIKKGATDKLPDEITVLYGGSSSLSTPLGIKNVVPTIADAYNVQAPVGFSPGDVIVATQKKPVPHCTLSTVNAVGVPNPIGLVTITQTPIPGSPGAAYDSTGSLVSLGQAASMGRIAYTVDTSTHALRTQRLLPTVDPSPIPVISEVVNLKAQYGLVTVPNGDITWQAAKDAWDYDVVTAPPPPGAGPLLATLQQIRAVRIAIVTRSAQYEKDIVTPAYPPEMNDGKLWMFCDPAPPCTVAMGAVSMPLSLDDQHYRYKVLETIVPLRNALWNAP